MRSPARSVPVMVGIVSPMTGSAGVASPAASMAGSGSPSTVTVDEAAPSSDVAAVVDVARSSAPEVVMAVSESSRVTSTRPATRSRTTTAQAATMSGVRLLGGGSPPAGGGVDGGGGNDGGPGGYDGGAGGNEGGPAGYEGGPGGVGGVPGGGKFGSLMSRAVLRSCRRANLSNPWMVAADRRLVVWWRRTGRGSATEE